MLNQTLFSSFMLSGLSDTPSLQLPLFLFFLLIYLLTLTWNSAIIILVVTSSRLHTPMYLFLGNLASLDICCSSIIVPKMLSDLYTQTRKISMMACRAQMFFFLFLMVAEVILLAIMSYDRYVAISQPLHYMQIMNWKVCVQLTSGAGFIGFINSLIHTLNTLKLSFCDSNTIKSFFCDLPELLRISCSDVFINILLIFLLAGSIGGLSLMMTFLSYTYIIKSVLKMQTKGHRSKIFSTCSSHLAVVFMFYSSSMSNYFSPNGHHQHFFGAKIVPVFYAVMTPFLNPLIYCLRNKDIKRTVGGVFVKIPFTMFQNYFKPPLK